MAVTDTSLNSRSAIELTGDNVAEASRGLPRKAAFLLKGLTRLQRGSLTITLPNGRKYFYRAKQTGPHGEAVLHNWGLVRRAMLAGSLGAAESYIEGDWDSPDVTSFLELFVVNARGGGADDFFKRNALVNFITSVGHWLNRNTQRGSKRNISAHYDLGNAFYTKWLDPSMTYSSAIFQDGANSLEEAQDHKYRSLIERTGIQQHHEVLEIGCGWGGFAEYAARNVGCKVKCLTISQEQYDFARNRISEAGLDDKVDIHFQDYRSETGLYDRIISIEMFEAVGEQYWPVYFEQLKRCLKADGKAGLQIITINERDFPVYRSQADFIQKYIFPGGMLPTGNILKDLGSKFGLDQISSRAFAYDYAATLAEWRIRFWKAWPAIKPLGFDDRFKRMWELYFHYCEAGFKGGSIDVRQLVFQKNNN